jgi:hypothetical protein
MLGESRYGFPESRLGKLLILIEREMTDLLGFHRCIPEDSVSSATVRQEGILLRTDVLFPLAFVYSEDHPYKLMKRHSHD